MRNLMSIFIVSDRQTVTDNSESLSDKIFHKSEKKQKSSQQISNQDKSTITNVLDTGYKI